MSTPDPEATEREALAREIARFHQPVWDWQAFNIACQCGHRGTSVSQPGDFEAHVANEALIAARRLSESEMRRDQAEAVRAAKEEGWERGRSDTIADHRPPLSGFDKRDNPYFATPSPEMEQENTR